MLFRITAMAVALEWASVQAVRLTTTEVMGIMGTTDLVTIPMGIIHTVTILTVHITPMVVDMVSTLMDMEWEVWDGVVMEMDGMEITITTMEMDGVEVQTETEKRPMSLITIVDLQV
jgi:hypothetical protein